MNAKRKHNDSGGGGRGRGRGGGGRGRGGGRKGFNHGSNNNTHRWGGVMSQPPKLKLNTSSSSTSSTPCRYPTVSIAIPGSVVSNAQTRELQTQLAGQIARAAAVFRIDEVIVFDDGLGSTLKTFSNYRRGPSQHQHRNRGRDGGEEDNKDDIQVQKEDKPTHLQPSTDPHTFLARILQYIECPQYLRRKFFPMHPDLQFAGLLPPLDAPHHVRVGDRSTFREGVVLEKKGQNGSLVNCGIRNQPVE